MGDLVGNDNRRIDHQLQQEVLRLLTPPVNGVKLHNNDNVRIIHFIHGGPGLNGVSNNPRKRYTREVYKAPHVYNFHEGSPFASIIFISIDETSSLHEDPM